MKKLVKAGLCGVAAVVLATTGCSKKAAEETAAEAAAQEASGAEAAETEAEEYVAESSVTLGEYKGIEVTVPKAEVTEEELNAQIESLLTANGEYLPIDGAAELDDVVNIDYKGLLNGEEFEGGTAEGFDLTLGSGQFIEGFEDGLVGAKKGEQRSLNLTFPEFYKEDLAGKDVVFEVTVNEVKRLNVPELTDEFVAEKYADYAGNVEEFKQFLYDGMLEQEQYASDGQRDALLLQNIMDSSEIVCATKEIDDAYNVQLNSYTVMLSANGFDMATYAGMYGMTEDDLKAQIRESAKEMAKQELVLKEIAKQENITVTDEDKEQLAKDYGSESVEEMLKNVNITQEMIDDTALMQKTLDFLAENAKITVEEE